MKKQFSRRSIKKYFRDTDGEHKWLTVVSPEEPEGVELVLEPLGFAPAATYQKALLEAGIPLAAFQVDDIQKECEND